MTRLFFRFLIAILLVVLCSFFFLIWWVQNAEDRHYKTNFFRQVTEFTERLDEDLSTGTDLRAVHGASRLESAQLEHWLRQDSGHTAVVVRLPNSELVGFVPDAIEAAKIANLGMRYLIAAALGTLGMVVAVSWCLAFPFYCKLKRQENTIARIADGDLNARSGDSGHDAIGRLSRRVDGMADRIQTLVQSHQNVLREVSHEMRTPLSRMKFAIELAKSADATMEFAMRLSDLEDDVEEMESLLEELFTFLRLDAGTPTIAMSPVSIGQLVGSLSDLVEKLEHSDSTIRFVRVIDLQESRFHRSLAANCHYLQRAVGNLLRNAARHATSVVHCTMRSTEEDVIIQVSDDGKGIPTSEVSRIFEPFQRGSSSDRGVGLGLSISKQIVQSHGGVLRVVDSQLCGACFEMVLPLNSVEKIDRGKNALATI